MAGGTRSQETAGAAAVQQQTAYGPGVAGIGGGLAGLADHAAAALPAVSASRRSSGSLKRERPDDGVEAEYNGSPHPGQRGVVGGAADGNNTPLPDGRKRRAGAGPGSRGVANLTPEQLAKKRANDREAQRAIRERTRNEIESLKKRIEELTNKKPYQELQAAIKAKEAVEAENAEIKQRLATVIGMLQPLLGPGVVADAQLRLSVVAENHAATTSVYQHTPSGLMPSQAMLSAESPSHHVSTPNGTASPAGSIDFPGSHAQHTQLKHNQNQPQQWQQSMAPEFCTGNPARSFTTQNQNSTQAVSGFQQHQATSPFAQHAHHRQPAQQAQPQQLPRPQQSTHSSPLQNNQYRQQPQSHQLQPATIDTNIEPGLDANLDSDLHPRLDPRLYTTNPTEPKYLSMTSGYSGQSNTNGEDGRHDEIIPNYLMPIKNCPRTCPLDGMLQGTLQERRQRTAEGLAPSEIIGPRYPSVRSLLNLSKSTEDGRTLHPISKVFADILHAFPHMSGEPERIAIHYIMSLHLRWQVNPTLENYEYIPSWLRPLASQITLPHPVWMDYIPFPRMRDKLIRDFAKADAAGLKSYWMTDDAKDSIIIMGNSSTIKQQNAPYPGEEPPVPFDLFAGVYTDTISLNWPRKNRSSLLESTGNYQDPVITPAFESHLRNLDNWTLGPTFFSNLPQLRGLANLKTDDDQIVLVRYS